MFHGEPPDWGKMTFAFAERPQAGPCRQVFATEASEPIDLRLFEVTGP